MTTAVKPIPGSVQRDVEARPRAQGHFSEPLIDEERAHSEIARLAFILWHEHGCPADSAEEDWFEAERRFRGAKI